MSILIGLYVINCGDNEAENEMKMKNKSHIYDMNRSKPRHGHKYLKYKICRITMMVIYIN